MKRVFPIALILAMACVAPSCRRIETQPQEMDDGWAISSPEQQGVDPEKIEAAYREAGGLDNIYSLLVVKNGFLVAETYFNGRDISQASSTASVTKSFTSALAGIALREGVLSSLDQRLCEFFPEIDWQGADPRKSEITLRQVLQMRSGYPWEEADGYLDDLFSRGNWIPLLAEFPLLADPGTRWGYSNLMSHMLAVAMSRAAGRTLLSFAQEFLFTPLEIEVARWPRDANGYYYGMGDMQFTPRNLARFGQLYLDKGLCKGRQVVPAEWVEASFRSYSPTTYGREIMSAIRQLGYGYLWWSGVAGAHRFAYAWGHGGQMIAVAFDLNMVVVATAAPQSGYDNEAWQQEKAVLETVGRLIASL
jgi:CubicO group peptidase (beta-lactamase class C family)